MDHPAPEPARTSPDDRGGSRAEADRDLTKRLLTVAATVPVIVAFALSVYRAATLAITHDEAWTYLTFVRPSWASLLQYDQNNHVLQSWLVKISTSLFGESELAIRAPALVGAALYLVSAYRLTLVLFSRPVERVVIVALLCLNPLVLDFLCIARGYSLALGLLTAAILLLVEASPDAVAPRRLVLPSALLGLALCAHSSLLFVVAPLMIAFAVIILADGRATRDRWMRMLAFGAPAAFVCGIVLAPYLGKMLGPQKLDGVDTIDETIRDLLNSMFMRSETSLISDVHVMRWPLARVGDLVGHERLLTLGPPLVMGAAGLLILAVIDSSVRRWQGGRLFALPSDRATWLLAVACGGTWALFVLAHWWKDVKYPADRFVIYLVPLITLLMATAVSSFEWPRRVFLAVGAGLLLLSLARYDTRFFRSWRYDAGSRNIFNAMEQFHDEHPEAGTRVGTIWVYAPAIDFYRTVRHADWMQPCAWGRAPDPTVYDYFIWNPTFDGGPREGYQRLTRDFVSGTEVLGRFVGGG